MCASPQQDVYVHLPRGDEQRVRVAGRDDGVPMGEADAEAAMDDDLGEREIGRVDVEVSLDELQVGGDAAEELEGLPVGEVA